MSYRRRANKATAHSVSSACGHVDTAAPPDRRFSLFLACSSPDGVVFVLLDDVAVFGPGGPASACDDDEFSVDDVRLCVDAENVGDGGNVDDLVTTAKIRAGRQYKLS